MGLDIYVGTLTRYHRNDWLTIVQQLARDGALPPVQVIRANESDEPPLSEDEAREIVVAWRAGLAAGLAEHGVSDLTWDEECAVYFTDKPAWECWNCLALWVAHHQYPEHSLPAVCPESIDDHPAYQAALAETRYPQLLRPEWWLPCDIPFTFNAPDAAGNSRVIGSSVQLLEELRLINDATWAADAETVESWYVRGTPDHGCSVEAGAQYAFALTSALAQTAVRHRLPMLLDY